MSAPDSLSEREREIVRLVATGVGNKQIAQQLNISSNTVKVHLRNIFAKANVMTRTELTLYAIREGLVQVDGAASELAGEPRSAASVEGRSGALASAPATGFTRRYRWLARGLIALAAVAVVSLTVMNVLPIWPRPTAPLPTPDLSRWLAKASLPTARSGFGVATYENQIYVIGGETVEGVTGVLERYNPALDAWTTLEPKPVAVADVSAAVIGGHIYVPGGRLASGVVTNTLEVFDPGRNKWERRTPLPLALSAYAVTAFEGHLYLFGGWDGETYQATVYDYDPSRDVWTEHTPMPTARAYSGAAVAGGAIYVVGGYDGNQALSVNEQYLPQMDNTGDSPWRTQAHLPEGRYGMGIASIADIIFIMGGAGNAPLASSLDYAPQAEQWQPFEIPISGPWSKPGLAVVETQIHVLGGLRSEVPTADHWAYQAVFTINIPVVK